METLAAFFALKCFVSERRNIHVQILIDNTTAAFYINNMGGIRCGSINTLSREMWNWAIARGVFISAVHISGQKILRLIFILVILMKALSGVYIPLFFIGFVSHHLRQILIFLHPGSKLPCFVSWLPDPAAFACDAFSLSWRHFKAYAFPPFCLIPTVLVHVKRDKPRRILLVAPVWPSQVLVSNTSRDVGGSPDLVAQVAQSTRAASQPSTPTPEGQTPASRLDFIRRKLTDRGVSFGSAQVICRSWSSGTSKQYETGWKAWCRWCSERSSDPFQASVDTFIDFLFSTFEQGTSYSTVNTYRSAVSSTVEAVTGRKMGDHYLVVRFLKGVYMEKPPQPRYDFTWDVSLVTNYLEDLNSCDSLKLKDLTLKTVTLSALVTAQRSQSLHTLNLDNLSILADKLVFTVADRTKTSRPGKSHTKIEIPLFPQDKKLCPRTHVLHYINRTRSLRSDNYLFISYCKPHKAVHSSTIARWVKTVLSRASIDTSTFKAHSVRSAVTSAALYKGASLKDVLKLADWSSASTFNRFYNKPISDMPVGTLVLS